MTASAPPTGSTGSNGSNDSTSGVKARVAAPRVARTTCAVVQGRPDRSMKHLARVIGQSIPTTTITTTSTALNPPTFLQGADATTPTTAAAAAAAAATEMGLSDAAAAV